MTIRPRTIVVAATESRARLLTNSMGMGGVGGRPAIPLSPASIRQGGARGLGDVTKILVADSAWPLPADVEVQLEPYVALYNATVERIEG